MPQLNNVVVPLPVNAAMSVIGSIGKYLLLSAGLSILSTAPLACGVTGSIEIPEYDVVVRPSGLIAVCEGARGKYPCELKSVAVTVKEKTGLLSTSVTALQFHDRSKQSGVRPHRPSLIQKPSFYEIIYCVRDKEEHERALKLPFTINGLTK